jgi:predicted alpha/beta-fold hydrolase
LQAFDPLFRNPHLATIAGSFWRRPQVEERWPVKTVLYDTEPGVKVLVHAQQPETPPRGELILVHGLEGSSAAGYARSMAWAALKRGFAVHRFNMRSCGGTDDLAATAYHGGQTSDLLAVLRALHKPDSRLFLVGFSLGGNVAMKLAGETSSEAAQMLQGVCSVSAPIDLGSCARALGRRENFLYQRRFLTSLKERVERRHILHPDMYSLEHLPKIHSIVDFDNYYTARLFGFGTADNYFKTQSSNQFLKGIRIPALVVTAQDDPLVPFEVYQDPALWKNSNLNLVAPENGGHLGFLARSGPRFWVDQTVLEWIEGLVS